MTTATLNHVRSRAGWFATLARPAAQTIALWRARARDRRELTAMDARMRNDIGLTEVAVWREVNKRFWQA